MDYEQIFKSLPASYVLITPNDKYTILNCSDFHLDTVMYPREHLIGKGLFEVFPDAEQGKGITNVQKIKNVLDEIIKTHKDHYLGILRYDIIFEGEYITKYWKLDYTAIIDKDKQLICIVQSAIDVTKLTELGLNIE